MTYIKWSFVIDQSEKNRCVLKVDYSIYHQEWRTSGFTKSVRGIEQARAVAFATACNLMNVHVESIWRLATNEYMENESNYQFRQHFHDLKAFKEEFFLGSSSIWRKAALLDGNWPFLKRLAQQSDKKKGVIQTLVKDLKLITIMILEHIKEQSE